MSNNAQANIARLAYVSPYPRDIAGKMIMNIEASGRAVVMEGQFHDASSNIGEELPSSHPQATIVR
ncbi:hypothetical protein [Mesorhizobium sp. WSM3873]|uniref:hypothetical protein n=1 Tax=Mesorhizobium sp. WSM3873 TaxID=1854056 RepID=UPI0007FC0907|nr:hypothetical protein [Mesorhizobium sp. WSM3873]OBQ86456.1 hypothetical protein A9K71_17170 [Mesorhizobium sp. WSM3873]